MLAIYHLLQFPLRELHLIGFTFRQGMNATNAGEEILYDSFYKTKQETRSSWKRTIRHPVHSIEKEIQCMRLLTYREPRLRLSSRLYQIILPHLNIVLPQPDVTLLSKQNGFRYPLQSVINSVQQLYPQVNIRYFAPHTRSRDTNKKNSQILHISKLNQYPGLTWIGDDYNQSYLRRHVSPHLHWIVAWINCSPHQLSSPRLPLQNIMIPSKLYQKINYLYNMEM